MLVSYTSFQWHKKCILTHLHFEHREVSFGSEDLFYRSHLAFLINVCASCDSTE